MSPFHNERRSLWIDRLPIGGFGIEFHEQMWFFDVHMCVCRLVEYSVCLSVCPVDHVLKTATGMRQLNHWMKLDTVASQVCGM